MEREKLKMDKIDKMSLDEVKAFAQKFAGNDRETKAIIGLKLGRLFTRKKISDKFLIDEEEDLSSRIVRRTYFLTTLGDLWIDTYEKGGEGSLKFKNSIRLSSPDKVADYSDLIFAGAKKNMEEIEKKSREIFQKP